MIPEFSVQKADAAVEQARALAERDPLRPRYHFRPVARWMNDPNGTIFYDGWYHLFYQQNPYGEGWGHAHWGHARSRDLVRWEHLPCALAPATSLGEHSCYSGCAAQGVDGKPVIIYTSIGERDPEQWAALSDDMLVWRRSECNPLLTMTSHRGMRVKEWRDPFVFTHEGRSFMLVGCKLLDSDGGNPSVLIYEAEDRTLLRWQYRGVFYRHPDTAHPHLECPNICRLGDSWVLFCAFELHTVEYLIGDIDWTTLTFQPRRTGLLDTAGEGRSCVYATNLFHTPDKRTVLMAWVKGFKEGMGWNGAQSLPRELSLGADGDLVQTPLRELESLRTMHAELAPMSLQNETRVLEMVGGDSLEIAIEADIRAADAFALELRRGPDGRTCVPIRYQDGCLDIDHIAVEAPGAVRDGRLELRVFLDKAMLEVFAGGGRVVATRLVYKRESDTEIALTVVGGPVNVSRLDVWKMKPVW